MRRLAVLILLLLVGCAGMHPGMEENRARAGHLVRSDPETALEMLQPVLREYPDDVPSRRLRASALENAGKDRQALDAWRHYLEMDGSKKSDQVIAGHRHHAALALVLMGDLPHRIDGPPSADVAQLSAAADGSARSILERIRGDAFARRCLATGRYLHGAMDEARGLIDGLVEEAPGDASARYLQCLVHEHTDGHEASTIDVLLRLVRSDDPNLARQVVEHLIFLESAAGVADRDRENIRGVLLRVARTSSHPWPAVVQWQQGLRLRERGRLDSREFEDEFLAIDRALADGDPRRAWLVLEALPLTHPRARAMRKRVVASWASQLLESGQKRLANKDLDQARSIVHRLQALPLDALAPEVRQQMATFTTAVNDIEVNRTLRKRLQRADRALRRRDHEGALGHLEGLEASAHGELRSRLFLLRARALLAWGDRSGALRAFDEVDELGEISDRRTYGVLLVEAGRVDEATGYLDLLPLAAMQGEVLDALLESLEKQGKWQSILSRLSDLQPLPARFEPLRMKACMEASERWIRIGDADRALRVLESFLERDELERQPLLELYLKCTLRAGRHQRAGELLGTVQASSLGSLPPDLLLETMIKLGSRLDDEQRYRILEHLDETHSSDFVRQRIQELAPRFGHYLPAEGSYHYKYRQVRSSTGADRVETDFVVSWESGVFRVEKGGQLDEEWWIEDGVWHRRGKQGELLVPLRIKDASEMPQVACLWKGEEWVVKVDGYGLPIMANGHVYHGCVKLRLTPAGDTRRYMVLYVAPNIGEIRREEYHDDRLMEQRELVYMGET